MNRIRQVRRLWETVRHLKPIQIYGRIGYRLRRPRAANAVAVRRRDASGHWAETFAGPPSLVGPTEFLLLNEVRQLDPGGWDDASVPRLWRYNLHYFSDLTAIDNALRADWHQSLLRRWVAENAPGVGTGWEPYPTSLRIVNWIKWALTGHALDADVEASLAIQLDWLTRRLEHHLLGNHLFSNAKALVYGGLYFEGPDADRWLRIGLGILRRELAEQVLPDGGHFERSPMYHALAIEDVLDLINIDQAFADRAGLAAQLRPTAQRMLRWLQSMSHPDGEIGFFNDAAFGIAPSLDALSAYATRLGLTLPRAEAAPLVHLRDSGYLRVSFGDCVALIDVAPVGPDYQPGHAHADTLSFELSVAGRRVFVNSGTSEYGLSPERLRQRGTAAHNTLIVGALNSSDVWSGFRVGRRAHPTGMTLHQEADLVRVACSHDGYQPTLGLIHTRTWTFTPGRLVIQDQLSRSGPTSEARFHLHPDIAAIAPELLPLASGKTMHVSTTGADAMTLAASTWHPRFGQSIPSKVLAVQISGGTATTTFAW
ncbi:hypothetical protein VE26_02310 [Devosia chinhatensis]|uniref:Uncharacterized protein n=2 Tax=Devosia chinhatensis TaxID=429727 RepID=A0A0F5FJ24_9HYPH|nr:hypothetical protein VE26_02310 [Devosia chinhatensis]